MARQNKTTTKKTSTNKATNNTANDYLVTSLFLGLILLFISLTGLFQWGLLGSFIVNGVRLVIGEYFPVAFAFLILLAMQLIIRGKAPKFRWRVFLGGGILAIVLTTFLHYQEFFPIQASMPQLTSDIYQLFRNELLTNQISIPMGGGLLGAIFYSWTLNLFGKPGAYFLLVILFFISLFMTINVSARIFATAMRQLFKQMREFFRNSIPNIEEIREVVATHQDQQTVRQPEYSQEEIEEAYHQFTEPLEQVETEMKRQPIERRPSQTKKKEGRLFSKLFKQNEQHAIDYTMDYQPVFADEPTEFVPYEGPALGRPRENNVILDLDYFDQMKKENGLGTHNGSAKIAIHSYEDDANEWYAPETRDIKDEGVPEMSIEIQRDVSLKEQAVLDRPPFEKPLKGEAPSKQANAFAQEASHWQEKASVAQHLMQDDVEATLQSAEMNQAKAKNKGAKNKPKSGKYKLPPKSLLTKIPPVDQSEEYERINENIDKLERTFKSFGVDATIVKANLGPAVTKYEIEPAVGVKVAKIVSLSDDIALALAARDVRIEAPIPGKSLIGIEVPNTQVSPVSFWEVIDPALKSDKILEVPMGRDVAGTVCLADLSKMPHLLIAGATGSGKSVGMNVIIVSLLMKATPEEVKFLMIDPKKVELTMYDELPHLLAPVVTNPRKAAKALNNVVQEMERRYELFAAISVRNIDGYNDYVNEVNKEGGEQYDLLPKIVVFIDELADLMLVASNEVETAIIRLAQMARAAGIHMIIATQRPSVDVITGIIKANVPSRLAFAVSSGTDSRTILDSVGAEKLLGRGDMLFQPMGMNKPLRVQGAYISDAEVERITDFIKDQREAAYDDTIIVTEEAMEMSNASEDEYFEEAVNLLDGLETISISQLQRQFRIGYNRAARLIDDLEAMGFVSEPDGSKPRKVLIRD